MAGEMDTAIAATGYFLLICFMFFCQHHVCESYFVPAINVFVDQMRGSKNKWLQRWGEEAVAGATICALGCNGPELFTNLISLYTHSDAGIGVVVGSEIFNLLIIIGAAIIFSPEGKLDLERVPFTRDVLFYALSIVLLFWAMQDGKIYFYESTTLLSAAVLYVGSVYFTTDVAIAMGWQAKEVAVVATATSPSASATKIRGIECHVEQVFHSAMMDAHKSAVDMNLEALPQGLSAGPEPPKKAGKGNRGSLGFQAGGSAGELMYENLRGITDCGEGIVQMDFVSHGGLGNQTLKIKIIADSDQSREAKKNELLDRIKKNSQDEPWIHDYDATIKGGIAHLTHTCGDPHAKCLEKFLAIVEFCADFPLRLTLFKFDVKETSKEGCWPLCFIGAMAWLAVFSFLMLEIANAINASIPALPIPFLGITVCAMGTSFPNAIASILMSQQNKPAAAIANALGSNVQNVFLAMALPWVIYGLTVTDEGMFPQGAAGMKEGVFWMAVTLVEVVFMVVCCGFCKLSGFHGYLLCVTFIAWLILTSCEVFQHFQIVPDAS